MLYVRGGSHALHKSNSLRALLLVDTRYIVHYMYILYVDDPIGPPVPDKLACLLACFLACLAGHGHTPDSIIHTPKHALQSAHSDPLSNFARITQLENDPIARKTRKTGTSFKRHLILLVDHGRNPYMKTKIFFYVQYIITQSYSIKCSAQMQMQVPVHVQVQGQSRPLHHHF